MCGESKKSHGKCQSVPGSPPHVWGKLPMTAVSARQSRITPTCVGKARTARINENREKDHPHMCGESSRQKPVTRSLSRITPTCVGKAQMGRHQRYKIQDHPHMCGESPRDKAAIAAHTGSPPHVWGKRIIQRSLEVYQRITPTCVGKALQLVPLIEWHWDHPHMCGESPEPLPLISGLIGSPPHVWGKL